MADIEHIALPIPDGVQVHSADGETEIVLTYEHPHTEAEALSAARELIDAHRASKSKPWYVQQKGKHDG